MSTAVSTDRLRELADEAQADIGMDYAWLDDVTTHDWTRYHKLKEGLLFHGCPSDSWVLTPFFRGQTIYGNL